MAARIATNPMGIPAGTPAHARPAAHQSRSRQPAAVLVYSEYSTKCKDLRGLIRDDQLDLFHRINADPEPIRQALLNPSNLVKIDSVPCILVTLPNGDISTYEGDKAIEWVAHFLRSGGKPMQPPKERFAGQDPPSDPAPHPRGMPVSSVDRILSGMKHLPGSPPDLGAYQPEHQPEYMAPAMAGTQGRRSPPMHIGRGEPDLPAGRRGPRRTPFQGITSERDIAGDEPPERPRLGEGHEGMRSSLPGLGLDDDPMYGQEPPEPVDAPPRLVQAGRGPGATMIEDLTPEAPDVGDDGGGLPSLDEDPSGMGIPRGEVPIAGGKNPTKTENRQQKMGTMGGRSSQKGSDIKTLALAMAKARESESADNNSRGQAPAREQRATGRKTTVQM